MSGWNGSREAGQCTHHIQGEPRCTLGADHERHHNWGCGPFYVGPGVTIRPDAQATELRTLRADKASAEWELKWCRDIRINALPAIQRQIDDLGESVSFELLAARNMLRCKYNPENDLAMHRASLDAARSTEENHHE